MLAVILAGMVGVSAYRHHPPLGGAGAPISGAVVIEVAGDGANPGFYCFPQAPTVKTVIHAAGWRGGLDPDAVPGGEGILKTGSCLSVMKTSQGVKTEQSSISAGKRILLGIPVNLNTVNVEELMAIPGIGPRISQDIVTYRNEHGSFSKVEDLEKVKGIGPKKLSRIRRYFTVVA